jgi:hypothetical protein
MAPEIILEIPLTGREMQELFFRLSGRGLDSPMDVRPAAVYKKRTRARRFVHFWQFCPIEE